MRTWEELAKEFQGASLGTPAWPILRVGKLRMDLDAGSADVTVSTPGLPDTGEVALRLVMRKGEEPYPTFVLPDGSVPASPWFIRDELAELGFFLQRLSTMPAEYFPAWGWYDSNAEVEAQNEYGVTAVRLAEYWGFDAESAFGEADGRCIRYVG